jgi:hypothetical protein
MIFQTLDNKRECVGVFLNGELHFDNVPDNLTRTWSYSSFLEDYDGIEYAFLYAKRPLDEACPRHLGDEWDSINNRLKAFLTAFKESKIDLSKNCFFDLVPQKFLKQYCSVRNKITEYVINNYHKPENYDFLVNLAKITHDMKFRDLNIDKTELRDLMHEEKTRKFAYKLGHISHSCNYNIFGTKTGRLTTKKNSFPILTMDKRYRKIIKPTNDWFVSLDFNGAELRTFLALAGISQPDVDVHEWNRINAYNEVGSRKEVKERFFAWLYNMESKDYLSHRIYGKSREKVIEEYYQNNSITNPFGRSISADDYHAMSYLIQSTCSDVVLRQMIKLNKYLQDKDSFVAFCVHDEVVLDLTDVECKLINVLVEYFTNTPLGNFKVNVNYGKNYGEMREWIQ